MAHDQRRIIETFGIGFFLAPLAGAIGAAVVLGFVAVQYPGTFTAPGLVFGVVFAGSLIGGLCALPVTVVVLPVTYTLLRRSRRLRLAAFPVAGTIAGGLAILAETVPGQYQHAVPDPDAWL